MSEETGSAGRGRWLELVAKDLKGADFERRLVGRTADGLRLEPLYDAAPAGATQRRALRVREYPGGWRVGLQLDGPQVADVLSALALASDGGLDRVVVRVATSAGEAGVSDLDAGGLVAVARAAADAGVELALDAGAEGLPMLRVLGEAAVPGLALDAGIDIAGAAWLRGGFDGDPRERIRSASQAAQYADAFTNLRVFSVSGVPVSCSGATASQELAWLASGLVEHLRTWDRDGQTLATMLARISLTVAVDRDFFREVAKIRALRQIVARVLDSCGLDGEAVEVPIHAVASPRTWSGLDPWTNLLRGTVATVAAAAGGVDSVVVPALDVQLGAPGEFGLRLARNTQLILRHESHVGQVVDPGAGSFAMESETAGLAALAWREFQELEAAGGLFAALRAGSFAERVAATAALRRARIARRQDPITGVSEFADPGGRLPPGTRPRTTDGAYSRSWAEAGPREAIATVGAMTDSAAFEQLRARAAAMPTPPLVYIATTGALATWKARGDWTVNALAAGGLLARIGDPTDDAAEVGAQVGAYGAAVAAIVCSDDQWERVVAPFAQAMRAAGVARVVLAGKPADIDAMRGAGVDAFVHVGCDLVALLSELLTAAGAPQ